MPRSEVKHIATLADLREFFKEHRDDLINGKHQDKIPIIYSTAEADYTTLSFYFGRTKKGKVNKLYIDIVQIPGKPERKVI